jgi:putative radical SAM enzyme (TIGR03279 family)
VRTGQPYETQIPNSGGGLVSHVVVGSPADSAGVREGDTVITAEGRVVHDILDWRWHSAEEEVHVTIGSPDGSMREIELSRESGEPWGLDFRDILFDGVRTCDNSCAFCFMTQLPRGMRPSLYVRDDDYRLSFLQGNFVTLTNLDDADVERILEQGLSPLHVSLHAVDADVRSRLICARNDRGLERLDQLLEGGIDVHIQIVAVPGVNDGDVLERSLRWLAEREGVESVGIVPLGYTGHQTRFDTSYQDVLKAAGLLDEIAPWHNAFRDRDGIGRVYAADEFYLNANRPVPEWDHYDDFPQFENGIGMVRSFVDEFTAHIDDVGEWTASDEKLVFVTGTLFAPVLESALGNTEHGVVTRVLPVQNRFFAGSVSVTGLLTGKDIVMALEDSDPGDIHVLPDLIFNADGVTLDNMSATDIADEANAHVRVVSCYAAGAAEALLGRSTFDSKIR